MSLTVQLELIWILFSTFLQKGSNAVPFTATGGSLG